MENIPVIINSIASLNAFILFGILFFRRNNVLPNYMLAGIMSIPGLYFANSVLLLENHSVPWLFFTVQFFAIFFVPFYSTYVYAILGNRINRLIPIYAISFVIGIIPVYLGYAYFFTYTSSQQELFFTQLLQGPYPSEITFYSLIFYSFQQIVFVLLLYKINRRRRKMIHFYSDIDHFKIIFLRNLTVLSVILNLSILVLYIVFDILIVEYILIPLIITIIYIYIVHYAFKNYGIFTKKDYQIHLDQIDTFRQETKTTLPEEKVSGFREELERVLIENDLVADPGITLKKLASGMNRPMNEVSKLIRTELNSNFYDVINSRRIERAKKMLAENNDFTVEGIGYEVGFNSRAAFYRAFKKHTGTNPTSYLSSR